jgi:hypothetical protein
MDIDEFKADVKEAHTAADINYLCFRWLMDAADKCPDTGDYASRILDVAEDILIDASIK